MDAIRSSSTIASYALHIGSLGSYTKRDLAIIGRLLQVMVLGKSR